MIKSPLKRNFKCPECHSIMKKKKELHSKRKKNAKTLISFIQRNLFHV